MNHLPAMAATTRARCTGDCFYSCCLAECMVGGLSSAGCTTCISQCYQKFCNAEDAYGDYTPAQVQLWREKADFLRSIAEGKDE